MLGGVGGDAGDHVLDGHTQKHTTSFSSPNKLRLWRDEKSDACPVCTLDGSERLHQRLDLPTSEQLSDKSYCCLEKRRITT